MIIGALGNIPFYVTMDESTLLSNLSWSSGARYTEHARHGQTDMLEYVGDNPDQIFFELRLSAFLGVNPTRMLNSLRSLHKEHKAVKFTLGTLPIPGYWVLSDMDTGLEQFYKDGTLLSADVKITLKEYIETVNLPIISNPISFTNRMTGSGRITPPATPQPSPSTSSRKPSVPPTTKAVAVSSTPVTKPTTKPLTPAQVKTAANELLRKGKLVVKEVGAKIVKAFTPLANLNIVSVIKKAFTKPTVPAIKAAPAKPVVVKPSAKRKNDFIK